MLGVNVSRDGAKLVTGSADKTARVWNVADGKTLATLSGHAGPITSVFLADDASRVATGSADQIGPDLGRSERPRAPENVGPPCGAWRVSRSSPDNKSVVSAGADNAVRVWVPAAVRVFAGHQGPIQSVAVLPNGASSVTASADKSIKVFDVKTGNLVRTLAGHTGAVKAVAVTKDGTKVISGSDDKTFRVWNVADGKPLLTTPPLPAGVTAVAAASNNALAAAGLADGTLKVYDLTTADAAKAERASFKSTGSRRDGRRLPARSGDAARRLRRQGRLALGTSVDGRTEEPGGPCGADLQRGLEPRRQARGHGRRGQDGPALGRRQGSAGPPDQRP